MAEEEKKKKSKVAIIILIIILIIAMLAGGIYIGITFFAKSNEQTISENGEIIVEKEYYELGEIFVNLKNNREYAKLTLVLGYNKENKEIAKEIESNVTVLKDTANFYFKSLTSKDFSTDNEKALKDNLLNKLNSILTKGVFEEALFTDILIQ